ncbi:MAG: hypothetical protein P1V21_09740 [Rhizobiaceae bacterium]|nr:hypothetical protein [Rhizobiaceae bacterium]
MSHLKRNLQLLWRAERVLTEARIKLTTRKLILATVAAISCLFAWGMLNVAGYFALEPLLGKALAALVVGLSDIVLALVFLMVAHGLRPAPEEAMVAEVRDIALGEIGAEVEDVQNKLMLMRDEVAKLSTSITTLVHKPMDVLSPALIGPVVIALTKLIRAKSKDKA